MIWSEMMASDESPYPWARVAPGINEMFGARFATREAAEASIKTGNPNLTYRLLNTDTGEVVRFDEP